MSHTCEISRDAPAGPCRTGLGFPFTTTRFPDPLGTPNPSRRPVCAIDENTPKHQTRAATAARIPDQSKDPAIAIPIRTNKA